MKGSDRLNEQVSRETVQLAIKVINLDVRTLARGLNTWMKQHVRNAADQKKKNKAQKAEQTIKGEQTVKELVGQGQGVSSMEVSDSGIRNFKKIANRYGVDFAIVKDKDSDPPRFTVFFKAKDADAINQVLGEYGAEAKKRKEKAEKQTEKKVPEKKRESILKKIRIFKEKLAQIPHKPKEKRKELDL